MTQAEITTQPAWATATEKAVGTLIGLAVASVATAGAVDFFLADAIVGDGTLLVTTNTEIEGSIITVTDDVEADNYWVLADAGEDFTALVSYNYTYIALEEDFFDGAYERIMVRVPGVIPVL